MAEKNKQPDPAPHQWAKLCAKMMDMAAQQLEIQTRLATLQAELEDAKKKHQESDGYAVRVRFVLESMQSAIVRVHCVLEDMQSAIRDVVAITH